MYAAHAAAFRMACVSRMKGVTYSAGNFDERWYYKLPFYGNWDETKELWSWRTGRLWDEGILNEFNRHEPWNSEKNLALLEKIDYSEYFTCPCEYPKERRATYVAVTGPGTAWTEMRKNPPKWFGEFGDMILFIETTEPKNHWAEPGDDVSPEDVIRLFQADPGLVKNSKQSRFSMSHFPKHFATVAGSIHSFATIKDVEELKKRLVIESQEP